MPKLLPHNGFASRRGVFRIITVLALLLMAEGGAMHLITSVEPIPSVETAFKPIPGLPLVLSQRDLSLYQKAFTLQDAGKTHEVDTIIAKVKDPLLRGVVLGERYL